MLFGCSAAQLQKASQNYDAKVDGPTTQIAASVAQVSGTIAATTVPGTSANNVALTVTAIAGAIIALSHTVSGGLKVLTATAAASNVSNTGPPAPQNRSS